MRIAVVGTYRSGSSAVAGMFHYLGIDMGPPFFADTFESTELAQALRQWWQEPRLNAQLSSPQRIKQLRSYIEARQNSSNLVGAKHPLLSLCLPEILAAWGQDVHFIWCRRDLEQSIASLMRLGWWEDPRRIQQHLYDECEDFFAKQAHIVVDTEALRNDPESQMESVIEQLCISPSATKHARALKWLRFSARQAVARRATDMAKPNLPQPQPKRSNRIVATILGGNAIDIVGPAVQSVIDWVDVICFIDTGSSDETAQRIKELAGSKFRSASFPWCGDFAAARNAALQIADEAQASWALTLDTDERLDFSAYANAEQLCRALEVDDGVHSWLVAHRSGSYVKERFVRMPTRLGWEGRTHETLVGLRPGQRRVLTNCSFWEVVKTPQAFEQKLQRDLRILREETKAHPLNPRWWYYLGQTYECLKRYRDAINAYSRCIELDGWADESAWACYTAARSATALVEYREAEEFCGLGMTRKPTCPEFPWLAGWCCFQRGSIPTAVSWSDIAVELGRNRHQAQGTGFRHVPAWYEAPFDTLRYAYRQLGWTRDADRAEQDFQTQQQARLSDYPQLSDEAHSGSRKE